MNSIEALRSFQDIIRREPANAAFCEGSLEWIENRRANWNSDRIRVGVIGVTSSGKSTLINAILGSDILSSAIVPSSGQLVCCSYGEKEEIIVHFENQPDLKLSGEDYSQDKLKQYSDERFNAKNGKGVLSIELTSPMFDFGEDVLLVDSPGLDALGLESHEKLTLESLVPTIDACIYVTTLKTNSDKKTCEVLNVVAKYRCPVIIVQNMLDSVRPTPDGEKSSEQVAREHKERVRGIVDESRIEDKDSVQIIQTSAEYAKRWRKAVGAGETPTVSEEAYRRSNYEYLVQSVTETLEVQRPRIERQRLLSVRSYAETLREAAQEKLSGPVDRVESRFPLQALKLRTGEEWSRVPAECKKIFENYSRSAWEIRTALEETGRKGFLAGIFSPGTDLETVLQTVNATVDAFQEALTKLVSNHNAFIDRAAKELNLPARDLQNTTTMHQYRPIGLEQKTETRSRRVKEEGIKGAVKRFLGKLPFTNKDSGYRYESYETIVTDEEATKRKIDERLRDAYERYRVYMENWQTKQFELTMGRIEDAVTAAEESYQRRRAAAVEHEALSRLKSELETFIAALDGDLPYVDYVSREDEAPALFTPVEVEASDYTSAILGLSRLALQRQHRAVARAFARACCPDHVPVIVSWDEGSTAEFLWQTGIADAQIIHAPAGVPALPQVKNRCLFVLVNAIQYGAAQKQIAGLKLHENLTKRDYVVWVVQDFQELLTGDQAEEGLAQMTEMTGVMKIPCKSSIYIMHENPIYNMAFLRYQFDRRIQNAPHELMDELERDYGVYAPPENPEIRATIGNIFNRVNDRNKAAKRLEQ